MKPTEDETKTSDPSAADKGARTAASQPRRRAHLELELEADSPDELHRALKRAVSRLAVGQMAWTEESESSTGYARVCLRDNALAGVDFVEAREKWDRIERERIRGQKPKA